MSKVWLMNCMLVCIVWVADTLCPSQEADITCRALEAAWWIQLECWSNNFANSHPSPCAFNCRVLHSCLEPQCSYWPYQPRHQWCLGNCDWMPASYTSGQPSNPCSIQLAKLHCSGTTLSLARCAMEPRHLLHLALTCPSSANAWRLKSRHPFVLAAQQLISLSDNTMCAVHWANHQWNVETTPQDSAFSSLAPTRSEWPSQEEPGSGLAASAAVLDVSAPACANGVWPSLWPVSVAQKNKPSTMLSSNVQSINLMDCTAWQIWMVRQSHGCSTPAPRSCAAKQWFEEHGQKKNLIYVLVDVETNQIQKELCQL